jgi:serine/threonine-protein kinase
MLGLAETPDDSRDRTEAASVATATVQASGFGSRDPDATLTQGRERGSSSDWPSIPGHEVIALLGEGGGGRVFQARQLKAGRRMVAVKVLHGTSRGERERLLREARSLGLLSHPNVVTIFDVGETSEGPYFTMEYMPGGSLAERTRRERPTPAEAVRIVEGVARGVAAAHAQGIRHRDLKPSNVLLAADGTPKVSDFGLAKFAEVASDASTLERMTPTGALLGTPAYMAPEQAAGRIKEVDERSDVYGIGAILYHCLTGQPPFSGESHVATVQRVLQEEIPAPRTLNREIDRDLEAVCLHCLEKQSKDRYDSATTLADELARVSKGEATIVRPPNWGRRAVRRLRRNRRALTVVCLMALFVATIAVAAILLQKPEDEKTKAKRQLAKDLKGDQVTLIGESGLPRWSEWKRGEVAFISSPFHEGVCSFATLTESRLELVPTDLVPQEYVMEAEIRHDQAGRETTPAAVGLYFNDHIWESGEGYQATARWVLTFNDFDIPPVMKGKAFPATMNLSPRAYFERPGQDDAVAKNHAALHLFQPTKGQPDSWRRFRIELRRNGLRVWIIEKGQAIPFQPGVIAQKELDDIARDLSTRLFPERVFESSPNVPTWQPTGAVGVFAINSQVSVKNMVLVPIRNP